MGCTCCLQNYSASWSNAFIIPSLCWCRTHSLCPHRSWIGCLPFLFLFCDMVHNTHLMPASVLNRVSTRFSVTWYTTHILCQHQSWIGCLPVFRSHATQRKLVDSEDHSEERNTCETESSAKSVWNRENTASEITRLTPGKVLRN